MEKSRPFKILFFLLSLLISSHVLAAERILSVEFVGLVKIKSASLKGKILSQSGTNYSPSSIQSDIKSLYDTGFFDDVFVTKESETTGLRLFFHVREKGTISSIVFKGNKKLKEKDLSGVLTIREYNPLDEDRIAESEKAISKLYAEKGLSLAEVSHELVPLDTEQGDYQLVFHIQENKEIKIHRVSFVGNKIFSDRKLAQPIKTKVKGALSFLTRSGKYDEEALQMDVDRLTYFYLNNGFLKVKIGKPQVSLSRNKNGLIVTFPVYEGDPYKVASVDIDGDIITTQEELLNKIKLKPGLIYSRSTQDQDVAALSLLYGDQAYAFANVYPQIKTNDDQKTADVVYLINKGNKINIERIDIKGNTVTHDKVIRREMQVKENAPYNQSALELSKTRLMQLGYFEMVNFSTPRGKNDNSVILVVEVKEKPTGTFSIGAGFSTLESFVFNASIQKNNFLGVGVKGSISANLSKLRQEFSLSVDDSYFMDTKWAVGLAAHKYSSALNRDFDQRSLGGSLTFGRELFQFFTLSVGYNIEKISVNNFSSNVPLFFQNNSSGLTSSILSTMAYDRRNNRITTTRGSYNAVTSEYAGNGVGGDNNYWKIYAESRLYIPLPYKSVFKTRGLFGYLKALDNNTTPLFERFFMGGVNSLRGYDINTVGPRLQIPSSATGGDQSFTYGGTRMILINSEVEFPLYEPAGFHAVAFFDAGQSFAENEQINISRIRSDYGFGLRWNSPFGPLRFEWGFPINRQSGESSQVFNFTIGQIF